MQGCSVQISEPLLGMERQTDDRKREWLLQGVVGKGRTKRPIYMGEVTG
jgi:hypothetical protein